MNNRQRTKQGTNERRNERQNNQKEEVNKKKQFYNCLFNNTFSIYTI